MDFSTTFRRDTVELCVTQYRGRDAYLARIQADDEETFYLLVADDGPDANFDPVDHWHVFDCPTDAVGAQLGGEDRELARKLNRAAEVTDLLRPGRAIARLSSESTDVAPAVLTDDDFNRLADEVFASFPGVPRALIYGRALRLKALEDAQAESREAGLEYLA